MLDPIPYLRQTAKSVDATAEVLTERVLTYPGFTTWSGSINHRHHYGTGGLLRHTAEVVHLCMTNAETVRESTGVQLSRRVLFLSALFHDVGKTHDYKQAVTMGYVEELAAETLRASRAGQAPVPPEREWVASPHHRTIHHINRAAVIWTQLSSDGAGRDVFDEVLHCILAHHGSPERGSPVLPQTREAWMLHLCDAVSAWMDGVGKMDPKP